MTRTTNARIAGFTLLFYIAVGIAGMILSGRASGAGGTAERLASMAQHATDVRVSAVLGLLTGFVALALGMALYAITREQDPDLAMLALTCRVGEGVMAGLFIPMTLGLLSLATADGASTPDAAAANVIGSFVMTVRRWNPIIAATFFAVGSALFSWLLLRGRMIPVALAWLGVLASVLLVVGLPLQLAGFLHGPVTQLMWIPMAAFEIPLGLWLLVKGVRMPPTRPSPPAHARLTAQ
jgi:Domain of unknown function (DUF4386)